MILNDIDYGEVTNSKMFGVTLSHMQDGYDLTIGTSDKGEDIDNCSSLPHFKYVISLQESLLWFVSYYISDLWDRAPKG